MTDIFQIGADGVDVAAIQREIEDRVARKKEACLLYTSDAADE